MMTATQTFGRRRAPAPPPRSGPASPLPAVGGLSPKAEAFLAELAAERTAEGADFASWRRGERGRRMAGWAVSLISFAPGLVSLAIDAPLWLSLGLEAAAVFGNIWLRRERWRRMREIVAWKDPRLD
jgi:hypothetical protein